MKEKKKILKVRPFNMANYSGGSGYLIFSIFFSDCAAARDPYCLAVVAGETA